MTEHKDSTEPDEPAGSVALPREEEEWLLDRLAGLIRAFGWERFCTHPLILPEERFFPDVSSSAKTAAWFVARRLLN